MFHSDSDGLRPIPTQANEVAHLVQSLRETGAQPGDHGPSGQTARQNGLPSAHSDSRGPISPSLSAVHSDGIKLGHSVVNEDIRLAQALQEMKSLCADRGRPAQHAVQHEVPLANSDSRHLVAPASSDRAKPGTAPTDEETRLTQALRNMDSLYRANDLSVKSVTANKPPYISSPERLDPCHPVSPKDFAIVEK